MPRAYRVELKSLTQAHLSLFHRWQNSEDAFGPFDEPSLASEEILMEKWRAGGLANTWLIVLKGKPIGFCDWSIFPEREGAVVVAVIIAEPAARGRGFGTEAHEILCEKIFAKYGATKAIEAYTDVNNIAEQRALEKSGFVKELTLRRSGLVRGEVRDCFLYVRRFS